MAYVVKELYLNPKWKINFPLYSSWYRKCSDDGLL